MRLIRIKNAVNCALTLSGLKPFSSIYARDLLNREKVAPVIQIASEFQRKFQPRKMQILFFVNRLASTITRY